MATQLINKIPEGITSGDYGDDYVTCSYTLCPRKFIPDNAAQRYCNPRCRVAEANLPASIAKRAEARRLKEQNGK